MPNRNNISLKGKTAFISGASKGMGVEIVRNFAEAGADLALTARDEAGLAQTEKLAREFGERAPASAVAREQCLQFLAAQPAPSELLKEEFIKISKDWDYAIGTGEGLEPTTRETVRRRILRRLSQARP